MIAPCPARGPRSAPPPGRCGRSTCSRSRPGITASELARRLGVTERAARRYVAILREADIPVESTRGPYGGYTLGRGLRLPPLVFSATEALGLVMAALDSQHAVADAEDPVGSALGKILRVLPTNVARQAVMVRETARAVPERHSAKPDPAVTSELVAAVAAQRQVRAGLPHGGRQRAHLRGRPVVGGGALRPVVPALPLPPRRRAAHLPHRPDHRGRGSSRAPSTCPADLDPAAELEANLGKGWEHETHVVFDAPLAEVRPWIRPDAGRACGAAPTGGCELVGQHEQRARRTPVSGWRACPSPSRWSAAGAARGGGRRWRRGCARSRHLATATSLPRFQPSEMGR